MNPSNLSGLRAESEFELMSAVVWTVISEEHATRDNTANRPGLQRLLAGFRPFLQTERNLHPLHLIEQISYEQLLSASIARFHFITIDKRSDSICALQLRAAPWRADSRFSIYGDGRNYLDISFYGLYKLARARRKPRLHQSPPAAFLAGSWDLQVSQSYCELKANAFLLLHFYTRF